MQNKNTKNLKLFFSIIFSFFLYSNLSAQKPIKRKNMDWDKLFDSSLKYYNLKNEPISKTEFINGFKNKAKTSPRSLLNDSGKVVGMKLINSFKTIKENIDAPYFSEKTMEDSLIDLNQFRNKVIVLNFWFSSCKPCVDEMPMFNKLVQYFKADSNVVFLAPNFESKERIQNFMVSHEFLYQILPNARKIITDFTVNVYPTNIIIDKRGIVHYVDFGSRNNANNLKRKINRLLKKNGKRGYVVIE